MSNNTPLWFNIACQISTLEERRQKILEKKEELDIQVREIEDNIALLELLYNSSPKRCKGKTAQTQTEVHLPLSQQLMITPLTRLQVEEEERKKRIFLSRLRRVISKSGMFHLLLLVLFLSWCD